MSIERIGMVLQTQWAEGRVDHGVKTPAKSERDAQSRKNRRASLTLEQKSFPRKRIAFNDLALTPSGRLSELPHPRRTQVENLHPKPQSGPNGLLNLPPVEVTLSGRQ